MASWTFSPCLRSYSSGRLCNRYLVSGDISFGGKQGQTLEVNTLLGAMPQGTRKTHCPVIVQDFYSGMRTHQGTGLFEPVLLSLSSLECLRTRSSPSPIGQGAWELVFKLGGVCRASGSVLAPSHCSADWQWGQFRLPALFRKHVGTGLMIINTWGAFCLPSALQTRPN